MTEKHHSSPAADPAAASAPKPSHEKKELLSKPTRPVAIDEAKDVAALLEKMQGISFQGRALAEAFRIWREMLEDECVIMMGMAGAMVPAGMRRLVVYMIENRLIDCLVSTGANFFHDIHESLGRKHFQHSPDIDDVMLQEHMIDRMYDTLADEEEFREEDTWIGKFSATMDASRPYTTREFMYLLGKEVSGRATTEGIVTAAYKAGIPLYCPAVADSSIGIGIAESRYSGQSKINFDVIQDVVETSLITAKAKNTGVVYFGGGTPKNFIQQAEVTAMMMKRSVEGHRYALQIVTDAPHWGGLSGCSFEEAQSWGKIAKDARMVTCHCDSTIAMPMLVTGLSQFPDLIKKRRLPKFQMGQEFDMTH